MSIEQTVDSFFAAIEQGDVGALERLYDDRVQIWHNFTGTAQGKRENIEALAKVSQVSTARYVLLERLVSGNDVAQRHEIHVTMKVGGERIIPAALFMTIEDGRVVRIHEFLDSAHVMREVMADPISAEPGSS